MEVRVFNGRSYIEEQLYFDDRMKRLIDIEDQVSDFEIEHECNFARFLDSIEAQDFHDSEFGKRIYTGRLRPREAMTSGRQDILRLFWDKDIYPNENFFMLDITILCYSRSKII